VIEAFAIPISWEELARRTARETIADNCPSLAAQLAYYFFLALFPALLFLVALASFFPVHDLMNSIMQVLARFAPGEVLQIVRDQLQKIADGQNGGLLTFGMLATIWSTTSGILAIIETVNTAYGIQESRPWWRVRLTAIGLTIGLAAFILLAFALVIAGPQLAEHFARQLHIAPVWLWTWKILQWPLVFALAATAVALVYYFGPDAEQDWVWITPGALAATLLWVLVSVAFKLYVAHFGNYNATYGTMGAVIILLLWFYLSALVILVGAEMNAEIEHASPYGKEPGEKVPGQRRRIGLAAARAYRERLRRRRPQHA
jgi:membrane protein